MYKNIGIKCVPIKITYINYIFGLRAEKHNKRKRMQREPVNYGARSCDITGWAETHTEQQPVTLMMAWPVSASRSVHCPHLKGLEILLESGRVSSCEIMIFGGSLGGFPRHFCVKISQKKKKIAIWYTRWLCHGSSVCNNPIPEREGKKKWC